MEALASLGRENYYQGRRVIIRPFRADDLFTLYPQPSVAAVLPAYRPWMPSGQLTAMAERLEWLGKLDPPVEIEALVLHRASATPLGFLCLSGIDPVNEKAEFSAAFFRGRGSRSALEAIHWTLEAAFLRLDLHKLVFYSVPGNSAAQSLMRHMKIPQEAVLREEIRQADGVRSDLLRYSLLRRDWLAGGVRKLFQKLVPLAS